MSVIRAKSQKKPAAEPVARGNIETNGPVAPWRGVPNAWEGHQPWTRHAVEVCIPVIDPMDVLPTVVELLRLQTVRPYIVLIDTGSTPDQFAQVNAMAADDLEVHRIASGGQQHASAIVSVALDLGMSVCRTSKLILTHQDCFLTRRDAVEELAKSLSPSSPVVGYQITPREMPDWPMMIGHTWSGLYLPAVKKSPARWCYTGEASFDTEYSFCRQLIKAGIKPVLIGSEANYTRNQTKDFDHVRSWPSAGLYSPLHREKAKEWMRDALVSAEKRIARWSKE